MRFKRFSMGVSVPAAKTTSEMHVAPQIFSMAEVVVYLVYFQIFF